MWSKKQIEADRLIVRITGFFPSTLHTALPHELHTLDIFKPMYTFFYLHMHFYICNKEGQLSHPVLCVSFFFIFIIFYFVMSCIWLITCQSNYNNSATSVINSKLTPFQIASFNVTSLKSLISIQRIQYMTLLVSKSSSSP